MKVKCDIMTPLHHQVCFHDGVSVLPHNCTNGIDKDVVEMFEAFYAEMDARMHCSTSRGFTYFIEAFFTNREPLSVNDFTDDTFIKDCKIVTDKSNQYVRSLLKAFYGFVMEHGYGSFTELNLTIVNYNNTIRLINDGYTIITYNPANPVPRGKKWLLWDGKQVYDFNFSDINFPKKMAALQSYVWTEPTPRMRGKQQMMGKYVRFLNIMESKELKVSVKDVMVFKNSLSDLSAPSAAVYSSSVRDFVRFMKVACNADVSQLALDAFNSENTHSKPFKESYTAEQMQQIYDGMDTFIACTTGEMHDNYALRKLITQIVNSTPVRGENIQNLTLNCIEKAEGTDHYYLHYNPKNFAEDKIPLIPEVKGLFDQAIELTNKFRKPGDDMSNYIFIYRRARGNNIGIVSAAGVTAFIDAVCEQLELPQLGLAGVRNRFMEKVTRAVGAKGDVSKSVIEAASRHSASVHFQNYVDLDINQICLNMYGITVGTTELKGVVALSNPEATKANTVLNGRGHCTAASCEDKTMCDCLMCRRFKTTPDCIPFFEKEIKALEVRIYDSTVDEERKFLTAMKALNLKYLVALYEKGKEMSKNASN
ncbi:hypothetical protein MOZ60_08670 [Stecheria sp. CLA-KB-P133]|uniref:Uncharacterized protein n=1 Tax=Grylomicrobium aquisgranensis TaxID=2926318 RepID=A0AB35U964_9FIRM|nr:hypothetical protein [Stecheria sp. CLA-KB-P133]